MGLAKWFLYQRRSKVPFKFSEIWNSVQHEVVESLANGLGPTLTISLIACVTAARLSRWPRDPAPDSREWSGRIFAVVLVAMVVFQNVGELGLIALGFFS